LAEQVKVLFVSSGTKGEQPGPIVVAQGESIGKLGIDIHYFAINRKGIKGYLNECIRLYKYLRRNNFDIIHAHYTLSGWVAFLARPKVPIVLSLMGDDAYGSYIGERKTILLSRYLTFLTLLIQPFVSMLISKSRNIEKYIYKKNKSIIIPNGVNLETFQVCKNGFRGDLKLAENKYYVLFLGNKEDIRKNYKLAEESIRLLNQQNVELINPYPIDHNMIFKYLNSVNVFILTSFIEGSPNVIKEAMACNCPIVSTPVGDVEWLLGNTDGCYIASFDARDYAQKIKMAIDFSKYKGRTESRKRLLELGLDAPTVARKIINVYEEVLS
jgi:teichuronic acid biosynthesis glycosyltransferase TuaC